VKDTEIRNSNFEIRNGAWIVCGVVAVYVAWTGAWLLYPHMAWAATQAGGFAYWTTMKLLLWILPSLLLIHLSGRKLRDVIGLTRLRHAVLWGVAVGSVLGLISLMTKAIQHKPLLSVSLSWPFFSVIVIAPIFEEFMFRGALLGALVSWYRFAVANVIVAALFLGLHMIGWHFQGRLWQNLASPVGGALAIFLLGLVFGFVAHRSKSLIASILAHSLNNLFS